MASAHCILIVDDDSQSLEVLVRVLRRDGYHTVIASDGYTALEAARTYPIDIAIVDFNLPDATGAQVLRQIRQFHPSVPVLIMSADEQNLLPALEAGANSFIPKPINLSVLRNAIARALTRRSNALCSTHSEVRFQRSSMWIRWSRRIIWWKSLE